MKCLLCEQQGHGWQRCPLFGTTEQYLAAVAPVPRSPEELEAPAAAASLAPTLFDELYGHDENALAALMEDDDLGPNERVLATELLIGAKNLKKLSEEDRSLLNHMAHHLGSSRAPVASSKSKPKVVRDTKSEEYQYDQE